MNVLRLKPEFPGLLHYSKMQDLVELRSKRSHTRLRHMKQARRGRLYSAVVLAELKQEEH